MSGKELIELIPESAADLLRLDMMSQEGELDARQSLKDKNGSMPQSRAPEIIYSGRAVAVLAALTMPQTARIIAVLHQSLAEIRRANPKRNRPILFQIDKSEDLNEVYIVGILRKGSLFSRLKEKSGSEGLEILAVAEKVAGEFLTSPAIERKVEVKIPRSIRDILAVHIDTGAFNDVRRVTVETASAQASNLHDMPLSIASFLEKANVT